MTMYRRLAEKFQIYIGMSLCFGVCMVLIMNEIQLFEAKLIKKQKQKWMRFRETEYTITVQTSDAGSQQIVVTLREPENRSINCIHESGSNKNVQSKKCPVGSFGPNCTKKCQHPYYGRKCKLRCTCTQYVCHFANGCPERNGSHLAFTLWTTPTETFKVKEINSTVSDQTLHLRTSTRRNKTVAYTSEYETKIKMSVYSERSTTSLNVKNELETFLLGYHIYIIFGLAGLLVLFVGIYVFTNVCKKFSNRKKSGRHNIQISSKEVDFIPASIEHDNRRTSENISGQENPQTYLSPVAVESHYEDIHFYHSPIETVMLEDYQLPYTISDDKNGAYLDSSTYLTPKSDTYLTPAVDPKQEYVEVIG